MQEKIEDTGSVLMKIVEAISISPQDARALVAQYEVQARRANDGVSDTHINKLVTDKIITRYSKMAAASGAATSLAGVVPGVGTAVAAVGGGMADLSVCMKLQIDMTMCLAMAINAELTNEDAKHMSIIIALSGSLEQLVTDSGTRIASKAGVRMVNKYLSGAVLQTIKELFKLVGISFTKKAAAKVIPFGIGVVIGASANYKLTQYVGNTARTMFLLDLDDKTTA